MSDVTHSMRADSAPAAARAAQARRTLPNGWWGAALLVATETALFGCLIASYFYLRFQAIEWPPPGIEAPAVALPLALTGVLVATSIPMFLASRFAQRGRLRATWTAILGAATVQAGYLAWQIVLFTDDFNKFRPSGTAYGSIYFTLLATHHAHVLIGLLIDAWLLARLAFGLTNYRVIAVRVASLYWYFVNAVAIAVVLTQLSPSL
jgi:cytochrome c oxidase subunit 3/cytochrome c oxidase subunit I+III